MIYKFGEYVFIVIGFRVLANYLLWRLILGLAPELTEKYQWVRNEYRKVLMVRN